MKTKYFLTLPLILLLGVWFTGCVDLDVENPNEPDADLALAAIDNVESLVGGSYRIYWDALHYNGFEYPANTLDVMAWTGSSSWGNFGMLDMGRVSRDPVRNTEDYTYREAVMESPWYGSYSALSSAIDGMQSVQAGAFDLVPARKARVEAFARFVMGVVHGWLALYFDQAFIFDETVDLLAVVEGTESLELQPYNSVYQAAIDFLDEAIRIAQTGPGFTLPGSWLRGNSDIDNAKLIQLANTFKARLTANLPRTPADRDNVNWQEVLNFLDEGLQETFYIDSVFPSWYDAYRIIAQQPIWFGGSYYLLGKYDESGNYENWLATSPGSRTSFNIETQDRRIHGPDSLTQRGKYFANQGGHWFDPARGMYFQTRYLFQRYCPDETGQVYCGWGMGGTGVHIAKAELDFLRAEALFRLDPSGNRDEIVDIINEYRVNIGELPPAETGNSDQELWEMITYEKRMETFATHPGVAYFDARGWPVSSYRQDETFGESDLPQGTAVHFPVPVAELNFWEIQSYTTGGIGQDGGAAKNAPLIMPLTRD